MSEEIIRLFEFRLELEISCRVPFQPRTNSFIIGETHPGKALFTTKDNPKTIKSAGFNLLEENPVSRLKGDIVSIAGPVPKATAVGKFPKRFSQQLLLRQRKEIGIGDGVTILVWGWLPSSHQESNIGLAVIQKRGDDLTGFIGFIENVVC